MDKRHHSGPPGGFLRGIRAKHEYPSTNLIEKHHTVTPWVDSFPKNSLALLRDCLELQAAIVYENNTPMFRKRTSLSTS